MNHVVTRMFCRVLIVLMAWTPFQMAQAAMIGTDQVVSSTGQADRAAVLDVLERAEAVSQMQLLGVDPATAKARVMAMTDEEVGGLARKMQTLPAGASNAGALILIIVIVAVVWWAMSSR